MYFIINITKPPIEVVLDDLNIRIGPCKAVDLDRSCRRDQLEKSESLKRAVAERKIQVRRDSRTTTQIQQAPIVNTGLNEIDLKQIRDTVRDQVQQELSKLKVDSSPEIMQAISKLTDIMQEKVIATPQQQTVIKEPLQAEVENSVGDGLDEEKLAQLHAKVVERQTKNAVSSISYQQNEGKGSIQKQMDELNDLLG